MDNPLVWFGLLVAAFLCMPFVAYFVNRYWGWCTYITGKWDDFIYRHSLEKRDP